MTPLSSRTRGRRAALVLALVAAGAMPASAQAPATTATAAADRPPTPFVRGQWGTEFAVNENATHLGFLRFRSPTKAWVLDVGTGGTLEDQDYLVAPDSIDPVQRRSVGTQVLLGIRSYRALTSRAVRTIQFGVTGSHDYQSLRQAGTERANEVGFGAGLQLDLGGAYFFTSGFSLGGTLTGAARYVRSESNGAGRPTATSQAFNFGVGGGRVVASLYF